MRPLVLHLLILFAIPLLGCAQNHPVTTQPRQYIAPPHPAITITMERFQSLDSSPAYKVTFHNYGEVIYDGKYDVAVRGARVSHIDPSNVEKLIDDFHALGFFTFKDFYTTDTPDHRTTEISITIDGKTKLNRRFLRRPSQSEEA